MDIGLHQTVLSQSNVSVFKSKRCHLRPLGPLYLGALWT